MMLKEQPKKVTISARLADFYQYSQKSSAL